AGNWAFVGCCRGISLAADNLREVARHMGASVAELSAADSGIGAHRNLRKSQECTSLCTVEIWMYRRECFGCTPKVFPGYTKECGARGDQDGCQAGQQRPSVFGCGRRAGSSRAVGPSSVHDFG